MTELKRNRRLYYFTGFLLLFIIEVLIAIYVSDDFVRPYLGDFLVVIMIYCFLMWISRIAILKGLASVLIISFAVEFFQLINIVKVLQYQLPEIFFIILGSSFSFWDLLAYSLGILFIFGIEYFRSYSSENSTSTITGK
ncbi:DUF2809 domain-containing protein [Gramella sp. GC03-9]|uniref:DUF2809 domain-containing protein n=1 Tax=Christiangramia oceanisediminis TaxID=2920386 RepID=A0A9X2KZN6_9FLAO|nr:DUF2809 domain-containing protein [Gramella oceanisediminis]MCP9201255.1 DUF2809 domain-containing protein [Gramella oceanisediminis]